MPLLFTLTSQLAAQEECRVMYSKIPKVTKYVPLNHRKYLFIFDHKMFQEEHLFKRGEDREHKYSIIRILFCDRFSEFME